MKKLAILMFALFIVLTSTQVKAFELFYTGQKDVSLIFDWTVDVNPETGEAVFYPSHRFGQSLQLYVHGDDDEGYLRSFITDNPALVDQIYMDMNLGNFKMQWDKFTEGFLRPSWFNLEHKFTGLRLNYSTQVDELAFLGVSGQNHWREEDVTVEPSDSVQVFPLQYSPVVFGSVQVWMNGEPLNYSSDFYVDTERSELKLLVPVRRTAHLRIRYLQESSEYLVFGGRMDHHFELSDTGSQLDGGVLYLHTRGEEGQHDLIGTEWFYQPRPWWMVELNAGLVLDQFYLKDGLGQLTNELGPVQQEPDWRISNQFQAPNLDVKIDYQVVSNRFQDLLNLGPEGRQLQINGLYTGEKLLVKHHQNYHWALNGTPVERGGDVELIWILQDWIPYLYYSNYDWNSLLKQHAIAELGYQVNLSPGLGMLTYLLGADLKTTSEDPQIKENTRPYLGVRYQKESDQTLGMRVYGERGLHFDQVILFGDWSQGTAQWKGQLRYQPGYVQLNQNLSLAQDVNVSFDWAQTRYFAADEGYLDLNLSLDFSPITFSEDQVWLNLIQEDRGELTSRTYSLGGQKSFEFNKIFYGEVGFSELKKYLTAGMRGSGNYFEYDLSYTGTEEWETRYLGQNEAPMIQLVRKNKVALSVGAEDYIQLSGDLEVASNDRYLANVDFSYPLLKDITVGVQYSGDKDVTVYHRVELRTVYHF